MKKKWNSPQAIFVIFVIFIILAYISIDIFRTNPQFKKDLKEVKGQYIILSNFLDVKVPIIDSTFKEHAIQINEIQESQIDIQETFKEIKNGE